MTDLKKFFGSYEVSHSEPYVFGGVSQYSSTCDMCPSGYEGEHVEFRFAVVYNGYMVDVTLFVPLTWYVALEVLNGPSYCDFNLHLVVDSVPCSFTFYVCRDCPVLMSVV